jgi:hypothetical protein
MSKIAIFIGREHHAQKLMNIGKFLSFRGHDVVPITANNAINLDPPQMNLGDYIHVYGYLTPPNIREVSESMRKMDTNTSLFWNKYSQRELMLSFLAFKNYLSSEDAPDAVLVLHENNFWTKPLSFLCSENNIPCFAFQEGLLRKKDQEDMLKQTYACEYSTKLFVWGDDSHQQYIDAGVPTEKILVTGAPHLALAESRKENKRKRVVYFLPLLQHYYGNPQKDITQLSEYCRKNNFEFVIRPHPFEKQLDIPFVTNKDYDVIPLILSTDIALVQHSTTALECLALGTPVIEIGLGEKNFLEPLATEQPAIPSIKSVKDFDKIKTTQNYTADIQEWIDYHMYMPPNHREILDIIAEEIESHL